MLTALGGLINTGNGGTSWRADSFETGTVIILTARSIGKGTGDVSSGFTQGLHLTSEEESTALRIGSLDVDFVIEGLLAIVDLKRP